MKFSLLKELFRSTNMSLRLTPHSGSLFKQSAILQIVWLNNHKSDDSIRNAITLPVAENLILKTNGTYIDPFTFIPFA